MFITAFRLEIWTSSLAHLRCGRSLSGASVAWSFHRQVGGHARSKHEEEARPGARDKVQSHPAHILLPVGEMVGLDAGLDRGGDHQLAVATEEKEAADAATPAAPAQPPMDEATTLSRAMLGGNLEAAVGALRARGEQLGVSHWDGPLPH